MDFTTFNVVDTLRQAIRVLQQNSKAQAIILAAGRGSRMEDATDSNSKCLITVGGKSIIQHQIDMLRQYGIDDVLVVVGYGAKEVEAAVNCQAEIIFNEIWDKTNSLYSLSLCRRHIRGAVVIMNCDVLTHGMVLQRILDQPGNAFAYDSTTGMDDEHMKIALCDGRLTAMSKNLLTKHCCGENVGLLSFDSETTQVLFAESDKVLAEGGHQLWLAAAVERVAQRRLVQAVDVADIPWIEIDYPEDLRHARQVIWPELNQLQAILCGNRHENHYNRKNADIEEVDMNNLHPAPQRSSIRSNMEQIT